jgi:predicted small secreted protein
MRRHSLLTALCVATAMVVAACGSDGEESGCGEHCQNAGAPAAPAPTTSEEAVSHRLGCGTYCQNAGGYGGGEAGKVLMRIETHGRVAPVGGAVPVELTCLLTRPCKGAILIDGASPDFIEVGRSDLLVEGGSTTTFGVPISPDAIAALKRGGGRLRLSIIADYGDPECPQGSILPCTANRDVVIDEAAP